MDTKYLTTIKTILETGSFQKAALRLNYTQSTVTFQVRQLENELGVRLFERVGRRMALTQAGREAMPLIDDVLASAERLTTFARGANDIHGTLRIAMPETILTYKSQPILKAFKECAPHVRLLIRTQNCYCTREQILNGELDAALHYDIGGYTPSIVVRKLADYGQALVASPDLAREERDFITPNQKKSISMISNDRKCISQEIFDAYLRERKIYIDNVIELWSIEAIKRSVESSLGVAFLPYFAVSEELAKGTLTELPTGLKDSRITVVCAYHKNKWISPALALFLELTEDAFPSATAMLTRSQEENL